MRTVKSAFLVVVITALFFLGADFVLSRLGVVPRKPPVAGTSHPVYHHDLKPDLEGVYAWGPRPYLMCTNGYGFKVDCANREVPADKHYDVAFIGDSFTEGIGVEYPHTFVGLYDRHHPGLKVVNLGVSSYSPSIYYRKVAWYLEQGFRFDHVVVLPDISDIPDEALDYMLDPVSGNVVNKYPKPQPQGVGASVRNFRRDSFVWTRHFLNMMKPAKKLQPAFDIHYRSAWTFDPDFEDLGPDGVEGGIAQAVESMKKLKSLLDEHNIPMTVAVYPWPNQLLFDEEDHLGASIWRDFCEREGCAGFIDINRDLFALARQTSAEDVIVKYFITGDFHYNEEGNRILFEAIERGLHPE